ncbi:hypothetical protein VIGAN_11083400 [Vigna angularis var. angularis]|uniref:Uncharacterized protein n=1 Tax=Vigna angularis var. angularis TaxID=157739 RepID=A0A0S3T991_PHAAN|nr:hypothetical protein VIGAN_11083400 [Vigna angularis var. angularis]
MANGGVKRHFFLTLSLYFVTPNRFDESSPDSVQSNSASQERNRPSSVAPRRLPRRPQRLGEIVAELVEVGEHEVVLLAVKLEEEVVGVVALGLGKWRPIEGEDGEEAGE